jgi:two-component system, cell cycle sensor histidine kinase PleC
MTSIDTSIDALTRHNHHVEDSVQVAVEADATPGSKKKPLEYEPWHSELLEVFIRGQLSLAPIMPMLSVAIALTAALWVDLRTVAIWLMGAFGSHAIQLILCREYFKASRSRQEQAEWIAKISASELLQAVCWVYALFTFWPASDEGAHRNFLTAAIVLVTAVRFLVVNNFMPVLIAGTGVTTIGLLARCVAEGTTVYYSLGVLVLSIEVLFLFIARQLQDTARDRVLYRYEKDRLIEELKLERDRAEMEREKAETANHAKSAFLANMSHELRTPLNAILGFSEILEREIFGPLKNDTYKSYAGDIHHSGRHLLELINDILDLSRIEAGRNELKEEPVHVNEPAQEAVHLLGMRASTKAIEVTVDIDLKLPKILVDRRSLNQIVINLLTNALKFSPPHGKVEISAALTPAGGLNLVVTDNGPGIPQNEIEQALSSFSRGSFARKKAIDGAGLGLPIVKGLMQVHGGYLDIQSEVGRGTSVYCCFPAMRVLSGPRAGIIAAADVKTDSQRKLIRITG